MDSPEGALVGTVNVEATGSENTFKENTEVLKVI